MSVDFGAIVAPLGAVATTLLGVFTGSAVGNRSRRLQWAHDQQAEACAAVLRESSDLLFQLAKQVHSAPPAAPEGGAIPTSIDWRRWNEALAMVNLLADYDIVAAAMTIDEQFWPVSRMVQRGWVDGDGWTELREQVETKRIDFVNTARRKLNAAGPPVRRLTGRPASTDPLWQMRRDYFEQKSELVTGEYQAPAENGTAATGSPGPGSRVSEP